MGMHLSPGERVVFRGHPSWRSTLGFHLKGVLAAALAGAVAALAGAGEGVVFLVVLAALALTVLAGLARRLATTYTITDRRLEIRRGLVSREVQETRLERVQSVAYRQTLPQRIARVGDIDFDTAANEDNDFVFAGVADPAAVVDRVNQATSSSASGPHGLGETQPPV